MVSKTPKTQQSAASRSELVLSIDPGNGWIKFVGADGKRWCIPGSVKRLKGRERGTPDDQSVLLDFQGERYSVGNVADQIGGERLFELGKAEYGYLAIAAAIAISTPPTDKHLKLRVLVPDADRDEWAKFGAELPLKLASFSAQLVGQEASIYLLDSVEVDLVSEGFPVWQFAQARNLIPPEYQRRLMGVLDAGTGDLTCTLFTETGEIVRDRGASFSMASMNRLVSELASILEESVSGYSPDRSVLMQAINDGTYQYQTVAGMVDFSDQWAALTQEWRKALMKRLQRDRWAEHWARLGMVFIVGGAAPLLKPIEEATNGRFKVLEVDGINHQVINAYLLSL